MTGEMYHIDQDGKDDSGNEWLIHAAIAKALRAEGYDATLQPFDQYQGPYILVGRDVRIGTRPYQLAVQNAGVVRLWLSATEHGAAVIYREDTNTCSDAFIPDDLETAIFCAKELMTHIEEEATMP